jgi:hypothetical protein
VPTILDEFVIKLGLDSRGFQRDASATQQTIQQTGTAAVRQSNQIEESIKKTQVETSKRFRQVEEVGKSAAQGFTKLRNEVGGLLATIAGAYGIEQFIKNIVVTDRQLGLLSRQTGVAVKDLAAFDEMGQRLGAGAGEGAAGIAAISDAIQHFHTYKDSPMLGVLKQLSAMKGASLALEDSAGKAVPPLQLLMALAERYSKMSLPEARQYNKGLGLPDVVAVIGHEGPEAIQKQFGENVRKGVPTDDDAKAAQNFTNAFRDLQQTVEDVGRALFKDFEPYLSATLRSMSEWVIHLRDTPGLMKKIETTITETLDGIKNFGMQVNAVVEFMGGWKTVSEAFLVIWAVRWISPVVGVVAALAGAFGGLATSIGAVDLAAGGGGIKWLLGLLSGTAGAALLAALGAEGLYYGTRILPAGDEDEERRQLGGRFSDRFPNLVVPKGGASNERKASVRDRLSGELGISPEAAAGAVSNLNAESGLRSDINEINPLIPGSRGGFGLAQHTGPRREGLEAYARAHGLDPGSDDANIGFIKEELNSPKYRAILEQLRRPGITPSEAANAFFPYESGNDPRLEHLRGGHVGAAEDIAKLPRTMPPVGPTFGPQLPPRSAIDPSWQYAHRSPAALVNNSRSINSSSETNINGNILIQTAADNAEDVSKDLARSLKRFITPHQADYGLA